MSRAEREAERDVESEPKFLEHEANDARAAIQNTLGDLQRDLLNVWDNATDVRSWVDAHPWLALGAASAAGFVTAAVLTPAANESAVHKWSRVARGMMGSDGESERAEAPRAAAPPPAHHSILGMILSPLVEVLKVALQNIIVAAVAGGAASAGAAQAADDGSDHNQDPAEQGQAVGAS